MLNVRMGVTGLVIAVLTIGAAQATQATSTSKPKSATGDMHRVVHSPYVRAAAAPATPTPGHPFTHATPGQRRHTAGRPHP